MTPQQVLQALDTYETVLKGEEAKPRRCAAEVTDPTTQVQLNHLLWMCEETRKFIAPLAMEATQGDREKAMRWLGFIQGVLWTSGVYSIEDMKNHNR